MARPTLMRHRKFIRLVAMLGSQPLARGVLEMLWDAAYESGDDQIGGAAELEVLAGWTGESGALANALIACKFVDFVASDDLRIHDLWHHAPDYVQKRRARELARQKRVSPSKKRRTASAERRTATGQRPEISSEHSVTPQGARAPALAPALAPAPSPARGAASDAAEPDAPAEVVNHGGTYRPVNPTEPTALVHTRPVRPTRARSLMGSHVGCYYAPDACARGLCIPAWLGVEWLQQFADPAEGERDIAAFVTDTLARLPDGPVGDEPKVFWRAMWKARHGSVAARTGSRTGDTVDAAKAFLRERHGAAVVAGGE